MTFEMVRQRTFLLLIILQPFRNRVDLYSVEQQFSQHESNKSLIGQRLNDMVYYSSWSSELKLLENVMISHREILRQLRRIKTNTKQILQQLQHRSANNSNTETTTLSHMFGVTKVQPLRSETSTQSTDDKRCPSGFVGVASWFSCYRFSNFVSTWHEAREYCSAFDANLLSLDSLKEAHVVDFLIKSNEEFYDKFSWWTSGNFMARNNKWMWTSRHHFRPITFFRWYSGMNESLVSKSTDAQQKHTVLSDGLSVKIEMNCLVLHKPFNYYWKNEVCNKKHHFICKLKAMDG